MHRSGRASGRRLLLAAVTAAAALRPVRAVTPGVDIPAPKVAVITVDGASVQFHPARVVVEQNDHVRWNWTGGSHNTTGGAPCTANGLWASALNSITTFFSRQFMEIPQTLPFFCQPHCGLGMNGQVVVTTPIDMQATQAAGGAAQLDWTG